MMTRLRLSLSTALASAMLLFAATLPGQAAPKLQELKRFDTPGDVAEIVAASPDGKTLAYTNSEQKEIGFVNITNPSSPNMLGTTSVASYGEPTSVVITPNGQFAIAAVKNDPSSGKLVFINFATRQIVGQISIGIGPDSIAITPDGRKVVIAIEDEEDTDNLPGQRPGALDVVTINYSNPSQSQLRRVRFNLQGVPGINFKTDAQPEFVTISQDGTTAAVTLQENNGIALVNIAGNFPRVMRIFSGGIAEHLADTKDDKQIAFVDPFRGRREPDAIGFSGNGRFLLTANEGDTALDTFGDGVWSGGRGWTIFDLQGRVVYDSGNTLEKAAAAKGLYPDGRSDNRGIEVEGLTVARFGTKQYVFLVSERGSFLVVYDITNPRAPRLVDLKPTGTSPEGLIAIPDRKLVITANEVEGNISIFEFK
uniref:Choice-of-anchor I domain-containing protein n=1 Tax=Cyanothece sp. (strain PCC 7425 / ATCC 29141) TaxID=395961 RepID=B8HXM9_CYAP4